MFLSAQRLSAWEKEMAAWFIDTWTPVMPSQQAIFTSMLRYVCWGEEAVAAAISTHYIRSARDALRQLKSVDASITAAFERVAKGSIMYSHRQHTTAEAQSASL